MLLEKLGTSDFEAVDRLPTIDKYAIGPRLAFGRDLFDRGWEPLQTIRKLFEQRNRVVHPKPRTETITRAEALGWPEAKTYAPTRAVQYLLAVSQAASALDEVLGVEEETFPQLPVGMKADLLRRAQAAEGLPEPTYEDFRAAVARRAIRRDSRDA